MAKYANYREQCTALMEQLNRLQAETQDDHDTTIEYCLKVAGAMLVAAHALIEVREPDNSLTPNANVTGLAPAQEKK